MTKLDGGFVSNYRKESFSFQEEKLPKVSYTTFPRQDQEQSLSGQGHSGTLVEGGDFKAG